MKPCVVRVHTNEGFTGETVGRPVPEVVARYLIGKDPFARERIYNDLKRGLRHSDRTGISFIDICLWDIAAVRNSNYYELELVPPLVKTTKPPVLPPEFTEELENVDGRGHVAVPQGTGIGVEMDWDYINAHTSDRVVCE